MLDQLDSPLPSGCRAQFRHDSERKSAQSGSVCVARLREMLQCSVRSRNEVSCGDSVRSRLTAAREQSGPPRDRLCLAAIASPSDRACPGRAAWAAVNAQRGVRKRLCARVHKQNVQISQRVASLVPAKTSGNQESAEADQPFVLPRKRDGQSFPATCYPRETRSVGY